MDSFYVVTFRDPEKILEQKHLTLKVSEISDSNLGLSFIKLAGFIFEEDSVVIDPNSEKLKKRFEKTKSFHLSIHNIISIEEVGLEHKGLSFRQDKSKLLVLPGEEHPQK